ncbi:MAG: Wzz/FepE/Etk N-terminal domain-containing protein [Rubrivivax sp.]
MTDTTSLSGPGPDADDDTGMSLADIVGVIRGRWKTIVLAPLAAGLVSIGVTALIPPTFTATTVLLPPQQAQTGISAALANLGSLGGLAGAGVGTASRGSPDQYVALMKSITVSDRIIDRFGLMQVYEARLRADARRLLGGSVRIGVGKKDGLITIDVDDKSPQRAADIANRYVVELRELVSKLAITEAQQRRVFFERELAAGRDRLVQAQQALQASGFNPGALKAEPKSAAESYARLRAEVTSAEVRLEVARGSLTDDAPEIRQQRAALAALREQLARAERSTQNDGGPDYISRYREFKYQETLFELYARQFELARVDESREPTLVQVIDTAAAPERKSKPARGLAAIMTTLVTGLVVLVWVFVRHGRRQP